MTNYRPISLLCVISKALERIVYNHLSKFFLKNNVTVNSQFGFRQHHSTTQQLLLFLDKVHLSLNNNASCDVIYLDFKKAFYSVPHNELLIKLWNIGITGNLWHWIREYLTGRHQRVCINGCHSSTLPVISLVFPREAFLVPSCFSYMSMISLPKLFIPISSSLLTTQNASNQFHPPWTPRYTPN